MTAFFITIAIAAVEMLLIILAIPFYFYIGLGYRVRLEDLEKGRLISNVFLPAIFLPSKRCVVPRFSNGFVKVMPVFRFAIGLEAKQEGQIWLTWWPFLVPIVLFEHLELGLGLTVVALLSGAIQLVMARRILTEAVVKTNAIAQ